MEIYKYTKKIKYKNNKFKISVPTWNNKFELTDGSYSVSDIQDYFQQIIKIHETWTGNPPIRIYVNKIETRIALKINTGYYLQFLTSEKIKLLRSTKSKRTKDKYDENIS